MFPNILSYYHILSAKCQNVNLFYKNCSVFILMFYNLFNFSAYFFITAHSAFYFCYLIQKAPVFRTVPMHFQQFSFLSFTKRYIPTGISIIQQSQIECSLPIPREASTLISTLLTAAPVTKHSILNK